MEEIWKTINGFSNYEVSSEGRVRRLERNFINKRGRKMYLKEIILKPEITHNGYERVALYLNGKMYHKRVASLVAEAFNGKKPHGTEIDHWDGNKLNNKADNLRYVTHKENVNNPITVAKRKEMYERRKQMKNPAYNGRANRTFMVV